MLPSELTNPIEQVIVKVHRNEAHFTYIYVFQADNVYKNPPPKCNFTFIFLLFLLRSWAPPMTLPTAGALTNPQLPATASNLCMTDARLGGVGQVPPILATPVTEGTLAAWRAQSSARDQTRQPSHFWLDSPTFYQMSSAPLNHANVQLQVFCTNAEKSAEDTCERVE